MYSPVSRRPGESAPLGLKDRRVSLVLLGSRARLDLQVSRPESVREEWDPRVPQVLQASPEGTGSPAVKDLTVQQVLQGGLVPPDRLDQLDLRAPLAPQVLQDLEVFREGQVRVVHSDPRALLVEMDDLAMMGSQADLVHQEDLANLDHKVHLDHLAVSLMVVEVQ